MTFRIIPILVISIEPRFRKQPMSLILGNLEEYIARLQILMVEVCLLHLEDRVISFDVEGPDQIRTYPPSFPPMSPNQILQTHGMNSLRKVHTAPLKTVVIWLHDAWSRRRVNLSKRNLHDRLQLVHCVSQLYLLHDHPLSLRIVLRCQEYCLRLVDGTDVVEWCFKVNFFGSTHYLNY